MRRVLYILGDLDDQDIDWISDSGEVRSFSKGEFLVSEGSAIEFLYILLKGQCTVSINAAGNTRHVATLQPGEIIGELSFLDSRPPVASVSAIENCKVLAIPCATLQRKLDTDSGFAARFYRALGVFMSDRLRSVMGHMGYGETSESDMNANATDVDELDPDVLDSLALAGKRFEYILQRLRQ